MIAKLQDKARGLEGKKEVDFDRIAALTREIDEWEVSLKETKEFLYCKLDLAITCLVLCTVPILSSNHEAVKQIHVARYDGVIKRANSLVEYEWAVVKKTAAENEDELACF